MAQPASQTSSSTVTTTTTTTSRGIAQQVADSAGAVAGGALLCAASAYLIYWNESRVVASRRSIREAAKRARQVRADKVDPANDHELIFVQEGTLTADAASTRAVTDPDFRLTFADGGTHAAPGTTDASEAAGPALLKIRREVEMLRHVKKEKTTEKKEKKLGGTETITKHTRTWYELEWRSTAFVPSDSGHDDQHRNKEPEYKPTTITVAAGAARLGAFTLSAGLLGQANAYQLLRVAEVDTPRNGALLGGPDAHGWWYLGNDGVNGTHARVTQRKEDPNKLPVGTHRVRWRGVPLGPRALRATLLAKQKPGGGTGPWKTTNGAKWEILRCGAAASVELDDIMEGATTINEWAAKALRCLGFLGVYFGLDTIGKPLITALGVIPMVEGIANAGYSVCVVLPVACAVTGAAMTLGWLRARPWLTAAILFGGAALGGAYFVTCTEGGKEFQRKIDGIKKKA